MKTEEKRGGKADSEFHPGKHRRPDRQADQNESDRRQYGNCKQQSPSGVGFGDRFFDL